jgi:hypothetical protein
VAGFEPPRHVLQAREHNPPAKLQVVQRSSWTNGSSTAPSEPPQNRIARAKPALEPG